MLIGAIILPIAITVTLVALLAVIVCRQKAKKYGTLDLNPVSMDKYSMWILVYCTMNVYDVWR